MVVHFEPDGHFAAHAELSSLFGELCGAARICDPYYGTRTLAKLALLEGCDSIRMLTKTPESKEKTFIHQDVKDFCKAHPRIELRVPKSTDFHDRFVLTDEELIILGHGLKDVGGKHSFLVRLPKRLASDVMKSVGTFFEKQWQSSDPLV